MKQNKIIVAVSANDDTRRQIIQRILTRLSFALTPSTADKLIKPSVHDFDLSEAYFVAADNFNFRDCGDITRQRLVELAARGILVVVGVRRLPREFEFISQAVYQ